MFIYRSMQVMIALEQSGEKCVQYKCSSDYNLTVVYRLINNIDTLFVDYSKPQNYIPDMQVRILDPNNTEIQFFQLDEAYNKTFSSTINGFCSVCFKSLNTRQKMNKFAFDVDFIDLNSSLEQNETSAKILNTKIKYILNKLDQVKAELVINKKADAEAAMV